MVIVVRWSQPTPVLSLAAMLSMKWDLNQHSQYSLQDPQLQLQPDQQLHLII